MDESQSDFDIKLNALRQKYLERCRRRAEAATEWVHQATEDSNAVQRLHAMAHEMAGSGATYGFPSITVVADNIEALLAPLVNHGEPLRGHENVDEVQKMVRELQDAIPDEI